MAGDKGFPERCSSFLDVLGRSTKNLRHVWPRLELTVPTSFSLLSPNLVGRKELAN
jgi:hypothetical protein